MAAVAKIGLLLFKHVYWNKRQTNAFNRDMHETVNGLIRYKKLWEELIR
jgi:hypothetical protein